MSTPETKRVCDFCGTETNPKDWQNCPDFYEIPVIKHVSPYYCRYTDSIPSGKTPNVTKEETHIDICISCVSTLKKLLQIDPTLYKLRKTRK